MRDMRTGPEHYEHAGMVAEDALNDRGGCPMLDCPHDDHEHAAMQLQAAAVHAALALAAALAVATGDTANLPDIEMWRRVAGTPDDLPPRLPFTSRRGAT